MTNTPSTRPKKLNQVIFVEYSKINDEKHFMTVVDSYRNILGRVYRDDNKKCELRDHTGRIKLENTTLQKIKNLFLKHEEEILSNAHKRRIESKKTKNKNQTAIPVE